MRLFILEMGLSSSRFFFFLLIQVKRKEYNKRCLHECHNISSSLFTTNWFFSDCHMLSQYLPTKWPIYFCQNFRLPYDIDNQCSPTSPLTSPANDDRARWSGWPPSPPPSPEPPVLGPDWLRLPGRFRPQNGRRKLSSTDLPFPQAMLWHNR